MSLTQRIRQLEKAVTAMSANDSEREILMVLCNLDHVQGETLTGYTDASGTFWPRDRTQWPSGQRPHGTLEEVWRDPVEGEQPDPSGDMPDPLYDYWVFRYFTLTREEHEALHGDEGDHRHDTETLPT